MVENNIIIWDQKIIPNNEESTIYLWNSYYNNGNIISLFNYVDINGRKFRDKYLDFIYTIGNQKIASKSIIDQLVLSNGFSYWWMTKFVEKSIWKSPLQSSIIRLFAIEEILINNPPKSLDLVSDDVKLNKAIKAICSNLKIKYNWRKCKKKINLFKNIYTKTPLIFQAISSLGYIIIENWKFTNFKRSFSNIRQDSVFILSYFMYFDLNLAKAGYFRSNYWDGLDNLIKRKGLNINWMHLYQKNKNVPNAKHAINLSNNFNIKDDNISHIFLQEHLSIGVLLNIIFLYIKLYHKSLELKSIKKLINSSNKSFPLWDFFKNDWYTSLRGSDAIYNLLYFNLFDNAMSKLPFQKIGLYICENQSWERAFIHAWKKYKHGKLIGVAHSTVRFWDLRYCSDSRYLNYANPIPFPDLISLNGQSAIDVFLDVPFPINKIVECEALRFSYLENFKKKSFIKTNTDTIKVLFLCDYSKGPNDTIMTYFEKIKKINNFELSIKAHPALHLSNKDYPNLDYKIYTDSLADVFNREYFDLVCTSNSTSAALDAYIAGYPLIIFFNEGQFNFGPLRQYPNVVFVNSPESLSNALNYPRKAENKNNNFFFLDEKLTKWEKTLFTKN